MDLSKGRWVGISCDCRMINIPLNKAASTSEDYIIPSIAPFKVGSVTKTWEMMIRVAIIMGFIFVVYYSITGNVFQPLLHSIVNLHWSRMIVRPSILWASMGIVLLGFRTALWFFYRPVSPAGPADAPFLTVIIPAYNEGPMAEQTIDSVATADYPADRLEICMRIGVIAWFVLTLAVPLPLLWSLRGKESGSTSMYRI